MLKKMFDFFNIALHGGTQSFNDAEIKILSFVLESLPENDKEILAAQIRAVSLVQRQHPGRMVVAYYRKSKNVVQLPYLGYEHCLAKVTYKSSGKAKTTALVLHDGRFMTFERNVPKTISDIESLVRVDLHPDGFSGVAEEIDAEEHRKIA